VRESGSRPPESGYTPALWLASGALLALACWRSWSKASLASLCLSLAALKLTAACTCALALLMAV